MITFQEILRRMSQFWEKQGCVIQQGYDLEVGAGTFNPATFLRCLGPEPYNSAYIEPSRRPTDGRYGENPNRLQHYFQYQTVLKPSPPNIQELYLESLKAIGFDLTKHDVRFVHDDWESQTHGAWGLGWEVWMDGMEVTQFTYFQSCGGLVLKPVTGEITYGIERLSMYLQGVDSIFDLQWNDELTYGDIYRQNEIEWSHYNFENASVEMWFQHFDDYEKEAKKLISMGFPIPAYDFVMKASHAFNVLDARGAISVTERARYIARVRDLACEVAKGYLESREKLGYPLLKQAKSTTLPSAPSLADADKKFIEGEKKDFIFEIGSEELPATFVPIGCRQLESAMKNLLDKEELTYDSLKTFGTPRRLAILISGLATGKKEQMIEKKGPAAAQAFDASGKPLPTAAGFFRSIGIDAPTLDEIKSNRIPNVSLKEVKNAEYLFANVVKPGKSTAEILADSLPGIVLGLEFPKKMRWSDYDITFARPIKWILALFGDKVIPFTVGPILSGNLSQGHTQLCRGMFPLDQASDYLVRLREHKVLADIDERKKRIMDQLDKLEKEMDVSVISREDVIPQVLHLVEWPETLVASFNETFLRVPKEVAISEMVEHQKYFPIMSKEGKLINRFVITADTTPTDDIRKGNERVISARLSDGVFLYEKGLKISLDEMNDKLKKMTYQKALGTVYDKMERIVKHAAYLQKALNLSDPTKVQRAATLCKADLASNMVFEFPELQGTIGYYYATAQGEDPEVARSIEEHWMPRGENSPLPQTETGIILSIADKFDNLISCFGLGLKPTSSSDPFALRRQMLGMIKILLTGKFRLPFHEAFKACIAHFPEHIRKNEKEIINEISAFTTNRVKTVFQDYSLFPDEIDASVSSDIDDIYDVFCKINALHNFRKNQNEFPRLYEVYKRAKGQLQNQGVYTLSPELLTESAEVALYKKFSDSKEQFDKAIAAHEYDQAYHLIAEIQPFLDKLFDEVKILDDNLKVRENRLALLQQVFSLFSRLLDFSKIKEK